MKKVLRLNPSGMPTHWLSVEAATTLYSKELVLWGETESYKKTCCIGETFWIYL